STCASAAARASTRAGGRSTSPRRASRSGTRRASRWRTDWRAISRPRPRRRSRRDSRRRAARPRHGRAARHGRSARVIPFFPAARPWAEHGARYGELIAAALAGGRALQGEPVAALEAALAERCGRRHAIAVGSGTDALYCALVAGGVRPGDEVIVPAM